MLNKNFILGLGIGIVLSTAIMYYYSPHNIPKLKVEKMAREMGMMYPDEVKAYFNNDKK